VMGQVEELAKQITDQADHAVTLFGHSWGAWIAYLLAYSHPELVKKVFLIGAGAFHPGYVAEMHRRRRFRLSSLESREYDRIIARLADDTATDHDVLLGRLGELAAKADHYCVEPIPENREEIVRMDGAQYRSVWQEGASLRESGFFVQIAAGIQCPLRVIQGREDPTPIEAVLEPLKALARDLKGYEIARCGHEPWKEQYAREAFWHIVAEELAS